MAAKLIDVRATGRQMIDRYELVAEIASGGMATVFLARLSGVGGFQRFVAIKRLHPHLAREEEFVQMFLDEARLAAGIHHPNVVPILEVGASGRGYYLVMEYIEGDTLARLLARAVSEGETLPLGIALRIILDMLAGLHAAHELRDDRGEFTELVHRDVSPQNVLVGADGISRIADFGVARAATRLSATRAGQLKGKIAYMAPEQAAGEKVDRRADVFAAGIVLWEVFCSRRLFKAEHEAATLNRVLVEPIPSPREHVPELPEELAAVCLHALERESERRFATCAQFADALERAAGDGGVTIAPPREVASYVAAVIGNEIREQRDAVRAWLALSEPSRLTHPPSSPVSTVPPGRSDQFEIAGVTEATRATGGRRGLVLGVGGILFVGAALGAAIVLVARPPSSSSVASGQQETAPDASSSEVAQPEASVSVSAPSAPSVPPSVEVPAPSASPPDTTPARQRDDFLTNPYR